MKNVWRTGVLILTLSASVVLPATQAQASPSQGYIAGAGTLTDDFGDEGPLSQSSYADTCASKMWQFILYADGATESNGTAFDLADIDGEFGPNTAAATRDWQRDRGLTADGIVGRNTFSTADNRLVSANYENWNVRYNGTSHDFYLIRDSGGGGELPNAYFFPSGSLYTVGGVIVGSGNTLAQYAFC